MSESRARAWLEPIGLAMGAVSALAVWIYSFLHTTPLFRNASDVPSVTHVIPSQRWVNAVEQGRQHARATVVEQNLPGLSVAVGVGGDLVWAEGFGWADLEKRIPVARQTRFRIGHASKALTSAAVGLLLEKRRLRLDDEIQTYVPAFPKKEWPITLRQLMGHVAGVRHYENDTDSMPTAHCERASDGLRRFADDPLRFEPQTRYGYSTFGWVLVSAAVEAAADEPFFAFMRTQIFEPLGMRDTEPDAANQPIPDRVTFYYPRLSGDPTTGPALASAVDYSCFAGAGAFLSTPSDLVRFGMAISSGTLLTPATVTMLQTPQLLTSGEETAYGLGWMLDTVTLAGRPARIASHASLTLLGGSTSFVTFPEREIVVAMTSNTSFARMRSVAVRIAEWFAEHAETSRK